MKKSNFKSKLIVVKMELLELISLLIIFSIESYREYCNNVFNSLRWLGWRVELFFKYSAQQQ